MISGIYFLIFILFCVEYHNYYHFVNYIKPNLTIKQKSNILSVKSSLCLALLGIYLNFIFATQGLEGVMKHNDLINLGVLYFMSYLVMDIWVGRRNYHKHLTSLSGYTHHIVYIFINLLALFRNITPMYFLHMTSEIPTFLLCLGGFDSFFRYDKLFGLTFFLTRIVYHLFLTFYFGSNTLYYNVGILVFILHLYWFMNWKKKYLPTKIKVD